MTDLAWVILTQGTRPLEVLAAIDSIREHGLPDEIVVVENGGPSNEYGDGVRIVRSASNVGIPGGRDLGVRSTDSRVVAFLDDDAVLLSPDTGTHLIAAMEADPDLGVISFRIVDEHGETQRRHVPRPGKRSALRGGPVTTFLGGACAVRRSAYDAAGGYWPALFYAHEELDLSWRLHDRGFGASYDADIIVRHPRTPISRHAEGWWFTGRNRVFVSRRNLPWPIVPVHAVAWLAAGVLRAPDARSRGAYLRGWLAGWRPDVPRRPIRWRTVADLTRLGRPPIV